VQKRRIRVVTWVAPELNNLEDLFINQLEDLYDAEKRIIDALPKMAEAASSPLLANAFRDHLRQTENQVRRLDDVFRSIGREPNRETCDGMKGIIEEGEKFIKAKGNENVRDAALITAAQRVEHYEMAGYGTVRTFARELGHKDAVRLLDQTLEEEKRTDKKLTELAESSINVKARKEHA
jgi:ferritin-like metal-binding protein YciE